MSSTDKAPDAAAKDGAAAAPSTSEPVQEKAALPQLSALEVDLLSFQNFPLVLTSSVVSVRMMMSLRSSRLKVSSYRSYQVVQELIA